MKLARKSIKLFGLVFVGGIMLGAIADRLYAPPIVLAPSPVHQLQNPGIPQR